MKRDRKAGRSAYKEQSGSVEKALDIKFRTASCLQVYLPCSRYSLQLETMCCKVNNDYNNNNNTIDLQLLEKIANANKGQLYTIYNI